MGQNCCGYISDDDYRYDVHPEAHKDHGWQLRVTLEEMLKAEPEDLRPTFRERYAVLLIVASSFVQLHGTPWLLETPTKSNIIFFRDAQLEGREAVNFNQPHVTSHFVSTPGESGPSSAVVIRSLQKLGILLIELCFGEFLEDKVYRSKHEDKAGTTDIEREAFDVMAAKDWWPKVEDQAGSWMSGAIKWCLESNQSVQGGSNEWREEMTRKVVHPLHEGWKTFWQPGREDGQVLGRTGSVGGP